VNNDWAHPSELTAQIERLWQRGLLLADRIGARPTDRQPLDGMKPGLQFPLTLRLKRPGPSALANEFGSVRDWITELQAGSRDQRGFGYDITWTSINHRQLGPNRVPTGIMVPTPTDALQLIGQLEAARTFDVLALATVTRFPILRDWLRRRPLQVVENAQDWLRFLDVLTWFVANPRSGLYLRQLDIAGIDTKFVETRRGLISELLDIVLTPPLSDHSWRTMVGPGGGPSFEVRFGLRPRPALVRFRLLDPQLAINGLTDLTVPAEQFASLSCRATSVFITENEVNGLAFPAFAGGMVVFGLGYAVDVLASAQWLGKRHVYYWGDLDTHGFAMLDRLRAAFPHTKSLLMDADTLTTHQHLWTDEDMQHLGPLGRLTAAERAVYDDLRNNQLGPGVRLEQERVRFSDLERALRQISANHSAISIT
jgi:hypothetical protein